MRSSDARIGAPNATLLTASHKMTDPLLLVDVERRLGLFALAITGHAYHVRADTEFKSTVIGHRAGMPLSDGETLYLPEAIDQFATREENLGTYRVMALHQLGFTEFGTLTLDIEEAHRRVPEIERAPVVDAAPRESDFNLLLRTFPWPALARALFTVLEGVRIDYRMLAAYPGIRRDFERCRAFERDHRPLQAGFGSAPQLVEALLAWTLGHEVEHLAAYDPTGAVREMIAAADALASPTADVYTTVSVLTRCYAIVELLGMADPPIATSGDIELPADGIWPAPVSFHGEAPAEWQQREARLETWEKELEAADRGAAAAEMEHAEAMSGRSPGGERPPNVRSNDAQRDNLARRVDMERAATRHALGRDDRPSGASFLYDEWDMFGARYLRGWCRVYESRIDADDTADVAGLLERVAPHRAGVRRCFAEIKPRAYRPVRRVTDGDELDLEELLDYYTETRRGNGAEDRVYRRRDRRSRDVAAAFLLDLSASTDDPAEKPAPTPVQDVDLRHVNLRDPFDDDDYLKARAEVGPPPRRIIDVLRESLLLMASALEHYRDHWGLYGFSGYGRDNVEYTIVKELGERFGYSTLEALAALRPGRSTRMGPAIRHSVWKLKRTASPLKVLIMVSDGFPQDCDYGPDRGEHEYGVQDTAKALEEAQLAGIEAFCVTVDRSGHDYLKRMCVDERYLVIDELGALPTALTKVYQRLTGAPAARERLRR